MTLRPARSSVVAPAGAVTVRGVADGVDAATLDDDRLVRARRRAGAVDDANVGQRHDRRVDLDEATDGIAELDLRGNQHRAGGRERERHDQSSDHRVSPTTCSCLTAAARGP